MLYFLGLDVAFANNGICLLSQDENIELSEVFKTNKNDIVEKRINTFLERLYHIYNSIKDPDKIFSIYLEDLSYGSNGKSFAQICGLHYCTRYYIHLNFNIDSFVLIEPTKLKKFITGKGQCKKELILLKIYKKFGIEFDDNNLADAYGLARMALENFKDLSKED